MRSSLSFLFPYPFAQNTSFFHFVPCRFVLSYFFSFLFFSLFHKPIQTDNRLPVFFHGLLSKRACLLFPIFLSQPSLFSHAFPCILFSTIRGGNLIVIICQWNLFKKKNQFSSNFSTTSSPLDSNFFSLLTRDCNTAFTASDTPGTEDSSKLKIKH